MVASDITKGRIESLLQWSDQYGHDTAPGASEAAFLLRRVAKIMAAIDAGEVPEIAPLQDPDADAVETVRAG